MDGHCDDAQAEYMACQHAMAFHLPATQKKVHGSCIITPCLVVMKRKEYLGPKDPQMTQDYQEVWKEETVMMVIILQQCAIQVGAPPDIFCGAVQELHKCLAWVVEEGDLLNMEQEIQEGIRKEPMAATTATRVPSPKRVPSQMPRVEELTCSTSPDLPSMPEPEGAVPPQDLALVPRRWPPPLPRFSSQDPDDLIMPPLEDTHLPGANDLVGPLHTRVIRDDHLAHPGDGWGSSSPSGSELY